MIFIGFGYGAPMSLSHASLYSRLTGSGNDNVRYRRLNGGSLSSASGNEATIAVVYIPSCHTESRRHDH